MKFIRNILLILPLSLVSISSYGLSYFSVITSVDKEAGRRYTYTFDIQYVEAEPNEPSPCEIGARGCYLSINHVHKENAGDSGLASHASWSCPTNFADRATYPTMEKIINYAKESCGLEIPMIQNTNTHVGPLFSDECIGFFVSKTTRGKGKLIPGGTCGTAPQNIICGFSTANGGDSIQLDHGVLKVDEINNHESAPANFYVSCNEDNKIILASSLRTNYLNIQQNGALKSQIIINNEPIFKRKTITLKKDEEQEFIVKSRLIKGPGKIKFGEFNSRVTLVMIIP